MKNLLLISLFLGLAISLKAQDKKVVIKLSEPVKVTESYEVYGSDPGEIKESKSLSAVISSSHNMDEEAVVVKTSIA